MTVPTQPPSDSRSPVESPTIQPGPTSDFRHPTSGPVVRSPVVPWSRKRVFRCAACLLALCALLFPLYLARAPVLRGLANAWIVEDPLAKADCIVLLGGGREIRPFAAARLYREGWAPRVLIPNIRTNPTE